MKHEIFFSLEILYNYTNLVFTEKQKEDPSKLYDLLEGNEIISKLIAAIPQSEYNSLFEWTEKTIENFYKYRNSAMGIMEQISTDYSNLDIDAAKIQSEIADPENLKLLKNVMEKLG